MACRNCRWYIWKPHSTSGTAGQSTGGNTIRDKFKSALTVPEGTNNNYAAVNPNSSARGKYQVLWKAHSDAIAKITGVKKEEDYLKNNVAQEQYMDYLFDSYSKNVPTLKSKFPGASDEVYMAMEHFLGLPDTNLYLQAYQSAKRNNLGDIEAHSTAQQALNQAYLKRYGKVYKNSTVLDYLTQFANTFNK